MEYMMGIMEKFIQHKAQMFVLPTLDWIRQNENDLSSQVDWNNLYSENDGYPPEDVILASYPSDEIWMSAYSDQKERVDDWYDPEEFTEEQAQQIFAVDVVADALSQQALNDEPERLEEKEREEEALRAEENEKLIASIIDGNSDAGAKFWMKDNDSRENKRYWGRVLSRNAVVRKLLELGGEVTYISNLSSIYISLPNGMSFRVSDHELPQTPQREHNRSQGFGGNWDMDVDTSQSPEDAIADVMEEISEWNA